eukprot:m.29439 g.29439  ORF g.29439 m.29439 type:complete len:257 (-) comp9576_c1_seq1:436-1206(-)
MLSLVWFIVIIACSSLVGLLLCLAGIYIWHRRKSPSDIFEDDDDASMNLDVAEKGLFEDNNKNSKKNSKKKSKEKKKKDHKRVDSDSSGHVLFSDEGHEKVNPMFDSRRASTADLDSNGALSEKRNEMMQSIEEEKGGDDGQEDGTVEVITREGQRTIRKEDEEDGKRQSASSQQPENNSNNNTTAKATPSSTTTTPATNNNEEKDKEEEVKRKREERRAKLKAARERKKKEEWESLEESLAIIEEMYKDIVHTDA